MVGWHHQLSGYDLEQTPGDSEGQGSLACCRPWAREESDTTECLNSGNIVECHSAMRRSEVLTPGDP